MDGTQRLFVALYPPVEVVAELSAALAGVRQHRQDEGLVRWNDPQLWHLTLAFMPAVAAERLPHLRSQLAQCARRHQEPVVLRTQGAGAFGRSYLWWALGQDESVRWLTQLARDVRRSCRAAGAGPDDSSPWRPHITIGRVRRDAPAGTARSWVSSLAQVESQPWTPDSIALVSSLTGPKVIHTPVNVWALVE